MTCKHLEWTKLNSYLRKCKNCGLVEPDEDDSDVPPEQDEEWDDTFERQREFRKQNPV